MRMNKEIYPNINERFKGLITDRLKHIEERKTWLGRSLGSLSDYSRGFGIGQVHRLIAERYFLETLLETLDTYGDLIKAMLEEDAIPTNIRHSDGLFRCPCCGDKILKPGDCYNPCCLNHGNRQR